MISILQESARDRGNEKPRHAEMAPICLRYEKATAFASREEPPSFPRTPIWSERSRGRTIEARKPRSGLPYLIAALGHRHPGQAIVIGMQSSQDDILRLAQERGEQLDVAAIKTG